MAYGINADRNVITSICKFHLTFRFLTAFHQNFDKIPKIKKGVKFIRKRNKPLSVAGGWHQTENRGSILIIAYKTWYLCRVSPCLYLTSLSMIPSSEGTPTLIALASSGSSWFDLRESNISAVVCRLRDQIMRRRGKCRASNDSFDMILFSVTSSPISLADCHDKIIFFQICR